MSFAGPSHFPGKGAYASKLARHHLVAASGVAGRASVNNKLGVINLEMETTLEKKTTEIALVLLLSND